MMYEQTYYKSMRSGETYRCPPSGQVILVIDNEFNEGFGADTWCITYLILDSEMDGNEGRVIRELYTYWRCGSWSRVS